MTVFISLSSLVFRRLLIGLKYSLVSCDFEECPVSLSSHVFQRLVFCGQRRLKCYAFHGIHFHYEIVLFLCFFSSMMMPLMSVVTPLLCRSRFRKHWRNMKIQAEYRMIVLSITVKNSRWNQKPKNTSVSEKCVIEKKNQIKERGAKKTNDLIPSNAFLVLPVGSFMQHFLGLALLGNKTTGCSWHCLGEVKQKENRKTCRTSCNT